VTPAARREYVRTLRPRSTLALAHAKSQILDECYATTGSHRQQAVALLNPPRPHARPHTGIAPPPPPRRRTVLAAIWDPAGSPWSSRLKALLPLGVP